jgi:hypothetical protein
MINSEQELRDLARIKAPIIKAYGDREQIQVNTTNGWKDRNNFTIDEFFINEVRIKPKKKVVPFTYEDRRELIGKGVESNGMDIVQIIETVTKKGIALSTGPNTYTELLQYYKFLDGSPCGKTIEE